MTCRFSILLVAVVCATAVRAQDAKPGDAVTITADCSSTQGVLRRAERFNSDSLLRPPSSAVVRKMAAALGPDEIRRSWVYVHSYYNLQPDAQAFHWVVHHISNDRKTQMLEDLRWTPYGCSLKMLKLLRGEKIRCDVAVDKARGVFSVASRDASSVAVMLWNYQHAGTASKRVALRVENLPPALAGKPFRARRYLIDAAHSNCYHDPQQADLQVVEDRVMPGGRVGRFEILLEPNALCLVELLRAEGRGR